MKLLAKQPKSDTKTLSVMVRPELDQFAAWEREAKRRGLAVSALAMQLMDGASGWRGDWTMPIAGDRPDDVGDPLADQDVAG